MENITTRKNRKTPKCTSDDCITDTSYDSVEQDDFNSTLLDITTRSLPDTTMNNLELIQELQNEIEILNNKLDSAHEEIANLNLENTRLNSHVSTQNKKVEMLKLITENPTPRKTSNKIPQYRPISMKTAINCSLRISPIRQDKVVSRNHSMYNKETSNGNIDQPPTPEIYTQKSTIAPTPLVEHTNLVSITKNVNTSEKSLQLTEEKSITRKVFILADQQGRNMQATLQELLGSKYQVTCFWKPGATTQDILTITREEILKLTKDDYLIILTGCNDYNPYQFQSYLSNCLFSYPNTNIIVTEVPYNNHLNVSKLNNLLKFVTNQHRNTSLIELHIKSYTGYFARIKLLCRSILREILRIGYKLNKINFLKSNTQINKKTFLIDSQTQTESDIAPACENTIQTDTFFRK